MGDLSLDVSLADTERLDRKYEVNKLLFAKRVQFKFGWGDETLSEAALILSAVYNDRGGVDAAGCNSLRNLHTIKRAMHKDPALQAWADQAGISSEQLNEFLSMMSDDLRVELASDRTPGDVAWDEMMQQKHEEYLEFSAEVDGRIAEVHARMAESKKNSSSLQAPAI